MSMIYALRITSDQAIDALLADPRFIVPFLQGEKELIPEPAEEEEAPRGLVASIVGMFRKPAPPAPPPAIPLPAPLLADESEEEDLDKAWHGIHYLLTGEAWAEDEDAAGADPRQWLLYGGDPVGDIDVGYGPARAIKSADVRKWNDFLGGIDSASLRQRFNPEQMTKLVVYPSIWDRKLEDDDTLGYAIGYFETLKQTVASAAAQGKGLVVWLS
jgi:hypothetical protein